MRRKRVEENKECCSEEKLDVVTQSNDYLKNMAVGGDLGTLAYLQAIQNMNLLTQDLMRKSMGSTSNSITKEDIKDIVKEIVVSIMKELGAEVK